MNVRELIEKLEKYPPDAPVLSPKSFGDFSADISVSIDNTDGEVNVIVEGI